VKLSAPAVSAFDPGAVPGPVRWVASRRVVDLLAVPHDPGTVESYWRRMEEGHRFPPIAVVPVGGWYLVADGHKRLTAWRQLDGGELPVELWTVGRWLVDQRRQVRDNLRKKRRILVALRRDPDEARRLLGTTLLHWRRVARSLLRLVRRERRPGCGSS
jgi:hypothetical protein